MQYETLFDLASNLGKETDFDEMMRLITQQALYLFQASSANIMMINPQTRQTIKTVFKEGETELNNESNFVNANISGWVIENNSSFISDNLKNDPRFHKNLFSAVPYHSAMCVPLISDNLLIGTILLLSTNTKKPYHPEDLDLLEKFCLIVSPYLRNSQKLHQYFTSSLPEKSLRQKYETVGLYGKSKSFIELLKSIEAASQSDVRVLLEGKSGTGKELIARAIHHFSLRSHNKFIAVDCGAIPANLMESELFGHIKGAFTGASTSRKGLIEEADDGTFFLDEICNMPLELQAKFLRVLQEGEIRPLGSNQTRKVNVRFIAAASTSLQALIDKQQFREDLFYRLLVFPIPIPSLNERCDDIPILANHFIQKFGLAQKKKCRQFHEELIIFLQNHHWNGNIRELENFVERIVTLTPADIEIIDRQFLPYEYEVLMKTFQKEDTNQSKLKSLSQNIAEYERNMIEHALIENSWNQSQAARSLQITEQTIRYKIGKLGIEKPDIK